MNSKIIVFIAFALFVLSNAYAAAGELNLSNIDYKITGYSRPCCSFGLDKFGEITGISGVVDKEELGNHYFSRLNKQKDSVGIVYTCKGGFVDISHLRDNADWSAHIYYNLPKWLGAGREIEARREGGFKSRGVFFPKLSQEDIASLTEADLEQLAISIGYSMALMHEIPTAFRIAVSAPIAAFSNEKNSAFSIEDAYSNLLGNILGARAARSGKPYNQEMTTLLKNTLDGIEAQDLQTTLDAFEITRNSWWIKGFTAKFDHVLRRDFTYDGSVTPRQIQNAPFCQNAQPEKMKVPSMLSNGKSVNDYYQIRGVTNKRFDNQLAKIGIKLKGPLSQNEYPQVIEAIKADFVRQLGVVILER